MSMYREFAGHGFVTAYGPKLDLGVDASETPESPGAVQGFKDECDINNIMLDVQRTGATAWLNSMSGTYEDVTGLDFQTCMDTVMRAQDAFDALPGAIRDRFGNDPARFLDFVHDPANGEELLRMGLREPPKAPEGLPAPTPTPTPGKESKPA